MAIFRQFMYSNSDTEIEFMQGFIDLICADGDIICEDAEGNPTTAAAQYADLTSASTAAFYFNFGDGCRFSLIRGASNNNTANTFTAYPIIDNYNTTVYFLGSTYAPTATTTRAFFIRLIKSDNLFYLGIGNYSMSTSKIILFHCKAGNTSVYGMAGFNQSLLSATMQTPDSTQIKYQSILPYSAGAGNIDFVEKSIFISGKNLDSK